MGYASMLGLAKSHPWSQPMNIIERGKAFVQSLRALAARTAWD